jgi:hypothetical protein
MSGGMSFTGALGSSRLWRLQSPRAQWSARIPVEYRILRLRLLLEELLALHVHGARVFIAERKCRGSRRAALDLAIRAGLRGGRSCGCSTLAFRLDPLGEGHDLLPLDIQQYQILHLAPADIEGHPVQPAFLAQ